MSTHDVARPPSGVPIGGQFATTARTESDVALDTAATEETLVSPALDALIRAEQDNHLEMLRQMLSKGRAGDVPHEATIGSLKDSVDQMPDDIVEEITSSDAALVRAQLEDLVAAFGTDTPLDADWLKTMQCAQHGGGWGTDGTCANCTWADGSPRPMPTPRAVNLDAWEPGEDVDEDALVRDELLALRARVAELEAEDAGSPGSAYAHIHSIAEDGGFHPSKGVMPAAINAILDREDDGVEEAVLALSADDLGELYDAELGPALDRLQAAIIDTAHDRARSNAPVEFRFTEAFKATPEGIIEDLASIARRLPKHGLAGHDHTAAAKELAEAYPGLRIQDMPWNDVLATTKRHPV